MNYLRKKILLYSIVADLSEMEGSELGLLWDPAEEDVGAYIKVSFPCGKEDQIVQLSCSDEGKISLSGDVAGKKDLTPLEATDAIIAYMLECGCQLGTKP